MAVLMRSQLLAARLCTGNCSEAITLPKTQYFSDISQHPSTSAQDAALESLSPPPLSCAGPELNTEIADIVEDDMHTPRDAKNRNQSGADINGCVAETPEKTTFPKSRLMEAKEPFGYEKTWNIPTFNALNKLNADANEFVPGSFASLLPAILPSVPSHLCIPPPVIPPGLDTGGFAGMTSAWEAMAAKFGSESAWEQSTLSTEWTYSSSFPTSEASPNHFAEKGEETQTEARVLKLASCLLRSLLQAPILEMSDLLKVIESQLGEAQDSGPWCQRDLRKVSFSHQDLALLDARLAALLHKLSPEVLAKLPKPVKLNLDWDPAEMVWSFKNPPELRRLIQRDQNVSCTMSKFSVTFLSQTSGCVPVQLGSMLKFRHAGVACLQGLDSRNPDLVASTVGKGYGTFCTNESSQATIIWDRSFWTICGSHECDAGLAVDLISQDQAIRVACLWPTLQQSCDPSFQAFCHFLSENVNLVVCADLSLLGGTSSAGLVPALLGLKSAMFEMLGHEVLVPKLLNLPASEADAAVDFRDLWDPCGIFFRGVEARAALSGYTEGYIAKMSQRDTSSLCGTFPDGKPMLFAEFSLAGLSQDSNLTK